MKTVCFACLSVLILLSSFTAVQAGQVSEHPLIRPYPGSVLAENMSKFQKYEAHNFFVYDNATKKRAKKTIQGKYWRLLYEVRTPTGERVRDISKLEFFENFKAAALEKGGAVLYEDASFLVFTIPRDDGGTTWCEVSGNAGLGQTYLVIIDEEGFKKSLTFGPAELKAALDKDGRVLLYGILFDLDKAVLKQESNKQLQHIVSLLLQYPELRLEVQGHTDDQGADTYNMELSQRRAETVVQYLQLFGLDTGRLAAKGCGETKPVGANATEEGRAKNRRVELVKAQ
ncbi:MAG: OmpA family protein [Deltaproteobacteria bacterium]|nr:OmpA family protein [Deltaproteobacteria bacterium]